MKGSIIWFVALMLVGCSSGTSFVPVEKRGEMMHGQKTVNDSFVFHPGAQHSWMTDCTITQDKDGKEIYVAPCKAAFNPGAHFVSSTPILPGVVSTVVTAGAIVGGSYLIGDGISKSGSRTNINQSSESSSESKGGAGGRGGDVTVRVPKHHR